MEFWKYSAHGNDFLLIDNRDSSIKTNDVIFWKDVCKRRLGVGADGVIFVENSEKYDFHMRYLNADGGEVAMCGNGTRAISHFYKNYCLTSEQTDFIFSTKTGVYRSIIEGDFVSVEMTEAYDENLIDISKLFKAHDSFYLNTGVPHCVYLVSDVEDIDVVKNGREIRNNSLFSEGVNINFISKLKDKYAIRTYERGVEDETLSCGTGITAAAHMLFRTNLKAGNVSNDAWTFLEGLKMSKFSQHAHIVSKIDLEKLKQNKEIQVAKHAEFYRRVNLLAEMVEIFTNKRRVFMKIDEDDKNVTYFGTTTSDKIRGIFEYFLNVSNGSKPQIGDKFKMGYVGMRGSDKYDSPGLWGLEYRALSRNGQRSIYMAILNKIQELMDNGNMGISDNEMSDWLDFKNLDSTKKIKNAISNSYYRKKKISPDGYHNEKLNQILGELKPDQLKQLNELAQENLSIMMIFHNWDEDILVYNNPEILEKIYKAQMRAAHKIVKLMKKTKEDERKKETVNAVQMFLKDSRLINLFAESFELQDLDLRMKQ